MIRVLRIAIVVGCLLVLTGGSPFPTVAAAMPDVAQRVLLPILSHSYVRNVAQQFNSNEPGVLVGGSGYALGVGPRSIPNHTNGAPATITLSMDAATQPPMMPPSWLRIVAQPVRFDPEDFNFNFPLTARLPVAAVNDVANLFFLRYNPTRNVWTRSLFAVDGDPPTVVESTLFNLGHMAIGEYDGVIPGMAVGALPDTLGESGVASPEQALRGQGAMWVPTTHCPIGAMECFFYFVVVGFTSKYPQEVPDGALNGWVLRSISNVTAESPRPTLHMLPQGTYRFCVSALESPLTLTYLRKFTRTDAIQVTIDQPYRCALTRTCVTEVRPGGGDWGEASDDRPCDMGAGLAPGDPARLGATGDFQATLRWTNTSGNATDLDLHLSGPNGMHVYWDRKTSPDGSLRLDVDWQRELGNAVENIYQLKNANGQSIPMPAGEYLLWVDHYTGASYKPYTVRVIHRGTVRNFSGTLVERGDRHDLYRFTVP